jgi:hypothetical protein
MRDRTHLRPVPAPILLIFLGAVAACSSPASKGGGSGTGGEEEGGAPGTGGGSGGNPGTGGRPAGTGGSPAGTGGAPAKDAGATGGMGGSAETGGAPGTGGSSPADAAAGGAVGPACGMAGQMCCAGNTCMGGAMPEQTGSGAPAGMTVLELKASGTDPYKYFASKDLLPIDGPDSGYITDDGTSFLFVLHQNGAEETVSSGAKRQRNELTVNPGNPAIYKGMHGDTMSYTWRFKLEKMNADPTWCDIFQVKQHGTLGPAPFMAFEANKSDLTFDTQRLGVVAKVPLSSVLNVWISASVTAKFSEQGSLSFTLKKEDGSTLVTYTNNNINLWGDGLDFVRPKWGFYRNQRDGAGEAAIRYNDMKIIRGAVGGATCTCKN